MRTQPESRGAHGELAQPTKRHYVMGRRQASERIVDGYYGPEGLVVVYEASNGERREQCLGWL